MHGKQEHESSQRSDMNAAALAQGSAMGSTDACAGASAERGSGRPPRVLSIQSHVVSGYVGNKAAVFPLQVRLREHAAAPRWCFMRPITQVLQPQLRTPCYPADLPMLIEHQGGWRQTALGKPDTSNRVIGVHRHQGHSKKLDRCIQFCLSCVVACAQLLGFNVDPVLSVQFSNHTGFPTIAGTRMSGDELLELLGGLGNNDLLGEYTHLLTGALRARGHAYWQHHYLPCAVLTSGFAQPLDPHIQVAFVQEHA